MKIYMTEKSEHLIWKTRETRSALSIVVEPLPKKPINHTEKNVPHGPSESTGVHLSRLQVKMLSTLT